ncbi:hypothetical protein [Vibrio cortegadensis]|uniref:Outer membrane receptor protein n=1 Tax=Vibrio cortegadensis TaxID=1328770 RepID=A0ABV4M9J7_9VIBR|nr:hypothetical protein DS893_17635 [Vibrionales bacterium C3R12]
MRFNILCCVIASALTSAVLHAEESQIPEQTKEQEQTWELSVGLDYSKNGYKDSHHLADRNLSANASIIYNYNPDISFTANFSGYHSYDGARGDYWDDIWLTVNKNNLWNPTDYLAMSVGSRILIPVSDLSKNTDLQTAIRGNIKFTFALDNILEGLQISDAVRLRKNFHKYTTVGSLPLEEYRLSNALSIDYSVNDWFFNVNFVSSTSWSYRGTSYSPKLTHAEEIGYQFTDNFSSALGMTNSATYYDPDRGPSPLNTLFDLKNPTYYVTLNYNY